MYDPGASNNPSSNSFDSSTAEPPSSTEVDSIPLPDETPPSNDFQPSQDTLTPSQDSSSEPEAGEPTEGSKEANRAKREVKPQKFKRAEETLSPEAASAMCEVARQHSYDSFVSEKFQRQGAKLEELCTDNGQTLVFKALANMDVRGADLSGFKIRLDESDSPRKMRLEDFLLNASKKEIQRVMPHMVWSYDDEGKYGQTVFSADKEINDTIRERLKKFSKEFEPPASGDQRYDLTGLQQARSELLLVDKWVDQPKAGDFMDQAMKELEKDDAYLHSSDDQKEKLLIMKTQEMASSAAIRITALEWEAKSWTQEEYEKSNVSHDSEGMREYVNSNYKKRLAELHEQEGLIETPKYVQIMNRRNASNVELADGLKKKQALEPKLIVAPSVTNLDKANFYKIDFSQEANSHTSKNFRIAVTDSKANSLETTQALSKIKAALDDMAAQVKEGETPYRNFAEFLNDMEDGKSYVVAFKGSAIEVSQGARPIREQGYLQMVIEKRDPNTEEAKTEGTDNQQPPEPNSPSAPEPNPESDNVATP